MEDALTADEFTRARLALGLSSSDMARALGVTRATVHNLASGRVPVRPAMALLVRLLLALHGLDRCHPALPPQLRAANDNALAGSAAA